MKKKLKIWAVHLLVYTIMAFALFLIVGFCKFWTETYASVDLINAYRLDNHLPALQENIRLRASAQRSAEMIYTGERAWSHEGYQEIIRSEYGDYRVIGENLAKDFSNYSEVVAAWKKSSSHNGNLLHIKACEYGIGHYKNIWVLHLGCKS